MEGGSNRFVSEASLKEAQERRKEEWQKAYARLGQEAPPLETPAEKYDPRTLYEKLQEQKDAKQAAFEEKYSIRNQFRHGLEDDEASFIASVLDDKRTAEAERQAEIDNELAKFRQAVSAKATLPDKPAAVVTPPVGSTSASPPVASGSAASSSTFTPSKLPPPKKKASQKGLLAGAIKRKSSGGEKEPAKRKLSTSADASGAKLASSTAAESLGAQKSATTVAGKDDGALPETGREAEGAGDADTASKKRKTESH